jgi:hypothetical protein
VRVLHIYLVYYARFNLFIRERRKIFLDVTFAKRVSYRSDGRVIVYERLVNGKASMDSKIGVL